MGWDLQKVGKRILQRTYFWSCCGKSLCRQILLWGKLTPCHEGGLAHLELRINTWQENKLHRGSVSGLGMSVLQRLTHMLSFLHMNVPTLIHGCKHMHVHRIRTSVPFFSRSHRNFPDCKRAGRVLSRVNWTASAAGQCFETSTYSEIWLVHAAYCHEIPPTEMPLITRNYWFYFFNLIFWLLLNLFLICLNVPLYNDELAFEIQLQVSLWHMGAMKN